MTLSKAQRRRRGRLAARERRLQRALTSLVGETVASVTLRRDDREAVRDVIEVMLESGRGVTLVSADGDEYLSWIDAARSRIRTLAAPPARTRR